MPSGIWEIHDAYDLFPEEALPPVCPFLLL